MAGVPIGAVGVEPTGGMEHTKEHLVLFVSPVIEHELVVVAPLRVLAGPSTKVWCENPSIDIEQTISIGTVTP